MGGVAGSNSRSNSVSPIPKIIAYKNDGPVTTATGTSATQGNNVGGVCGNNQGDIITSYNTGSVSGRSIAGGVVGLNSAIHYDFQNNDKTQIIFEFPGTVYRPTLNILFRASGRLRKYRGASMRRNSAPAKRLRVLPPTPRQVSVPAGR